MADDRLTINGWKLPDPDDVGQSEYRALHDLLADALEDAANMKCDPADYCLEVLDNVEVWVRNIKEKLWQVRRKEGARHER